MVLMLYSNIRVLNIRLKVEGLNSRLTFPFLHRFEPSSLTNQIDIVFDEPLKMISRIHLPSFCTYFGEQIVKMLVPLFLIT